MVLGYTLGVFNMLHNPKRVKKSKKHAKKTEMRLAFEKNKDNKDLSQWMRKLPKRKNNLGAPPE